MPPALPRSPLFPYTTLFRSRHERLVALGPVFLLALLQLAHRRAQMVGAMLLGHASHLPQTTLQAFGQHRTDHLSAAVRDRKSTRLNSSHQIISYAVFCLKKK